MTHGKKLTDAQSRSVEAINHSLSFIKDVISKDEVEETFDNLIVAYTGSDQFDFLNTEERETHVAFLFEMKKMVRNIKSLEDDGSINVQLVSKSRID